MTVMITRTDGTLQKSVKIPEATRRGWRQYVKQYPTQTDLILALREMGIRTSKDLLRRIDAGMKVSPHTLQWMQRVIEQQQNQTTA